MSGRLILTEGNAGRAASRQKIHPVCRLTFHVPANDQNWHWGFHSCSGFSLSVNKAEWGGEAPLWRDVLNQHASAPMHVMCGGGDQLYNDALFKVGGSCLGSGTRGCPGGMAESIEEA